MKKYYAKTIIAEIGVEGKTPEWVLLFKAGWNELEGGPRYLVDREAFDQVVSRIARRGLEIVWDYEHQSLLQAKAPAAGWNKEYRWTERGIECRVDWTEEAAGYIAKQEYRYFSPVFSVRKSDNRLAWLHSVALTNTPKTNNLQPLLAKLGAEHQPEEDNMEFLKKLIAKLGLAENADEEQVLTAVDGLKEKSEQVAAKEVIPKDVVMVLGLNEGDSVSTVVASINALKQAEKGMVAKADFDALVTKLADRDACDAVAAALKTGKITPDQKDWASEYAKRDLAGFTTFVARAPVVVPLGKLPGQGTHGDSVTMTDETLQVAKLFGNTVEDLKKYGEVAAG